MANAPEKIDVDLLVVGTGNGGLIAVLCAYELGVKNVLTIEKSAKYGGISGPVRRRRSGAVESAA
jgi:succinate dehydrogenase/fumarate reductase flavoprotein subunit